MAEKIEYDLIVNGKQAKLTLEGVEKATKDVETQSNSTTNAIKKGWVAAGASIAAATATVGIAVNKAKDLSKATAGMSSEMKSYITELSNATGMTQEMIAGFVRSGETAGLAEGTIKKLTEQSIALGRAYPHESAETLNDNLIMLNKTGEAQGFIVDILEQKYGQVDLKAISLADKLKAVDEASRGVNGQFQETAGSKIDVLFIKANNALTSFGSTLLEVADRWGWLDTANEKVDQLARSMKSISEYTLKDAVAERQVIEENIKQKEKQTGMVTLFGFELGKMGKISKEAIKKEIAADKQRLQAVDERITKLAELQNKEDDLAKTKADALQREIEENEIVDAQFEEAIEHVEEVNTAFDKAEKEKQAALQATKDKNEAMYDSMSSSLVNWVMNGKESFSDFAKSAIANMVAMAAQAQITQAAMAMFGGGGITSLLSGFFHTGGEVKHTGGAVGGAFTVPSMHTGGVRSDERIIRAQVGESIINRTATANNKDAINAMNAGAKVGSGSTQVINVSYSPQVNALDPRSAADIIAQNAPTVVNIINKSLSTNGAVRQTMKQVM